jgi:hypothetical protein
VADEGYLHPRNKAVRAGSGTSRRAGAGRGGFSRRCLTFCVRRYNQSPLRRRKIEFTQAGPADVGEVDRAMATSAAYLRAQGFTL